VEWFLKRSLLFRLREDLDISSFYPCRVYISIILDENKWGRVYNIDPVDREENREENILMNGH